jgi:hypothetical protein
LAFLLLPVTIVSSVNFYASRSRVDPRVDPVSTGFAILASFDLAGVLVNGGAFPADVPEDLGEELRRQSSLYSSYRVDTLTGPAQRFWSLENAEVNRLWRQTIWTNVGPYLTHRGEYFGNFVGFADMRQCLPVFSGVAGPVVPDSVNVDLNAFLGLQPGPHRFSNAVYRFGRRAANTPLFIHASYAAALVPIAFWLLRRREYSLTTLATCALLFLLSYFIVGIACDFRYGYTLTVATTLLGAYVSLNAGAPKGATPL